MPSLHDKFTISKIYKLRQWCLSSLCPFCFCSQHILNLYLCVFSYPKRAGTWIPRGCFKGRRSPPKADAFRHTELQSTLKQKKIKDLSLGRQAESSPGVKEKPATLKCNFPHPVIYHANRSSKATSLTVDTSCATRAGHIFSDKHHKGLINLCSRKQSIRGLYGKFCQGTSNTQHMSKSDGFDSKPLSSVTENKL